MDRNSARRTTGFALAVVLLVGVGGVLRLHRRHGRGRDNGGGSGHGSSSGGAVAILWLQVHDCLLAVHACAAQFSDEGLLQLLLTCTMAGTSYSTIFS